MEREIVIEIEIEIVIVIVIEIERKCLEQESRARKWVIAGDRDRVKYEQLCTLRMRATTAHEPLITCRN